MKPPEVSDLVHALKDPSVSQRQRAARDLGQVDPATITDLPAVAKALEAAAGDKNKYVRMAVAGALLRLVGDNATARKVFEDLLADSHRDVRAGALAALGDLGSAASSLVASVKKALKDPEDSVQHHAQAALAKIQKK